MVAMLGEPVFLFLGYKEGLYASTDVVVPSRDWRQRREGVWLAGRTPVYLDDDRLPVPSDRIRPDLQGRYHFEGACPHVVGPAVPGAGDVVAFEGPLSERAAPVQA